MFRTIDISNLENVAKKLYEVTQGVLFDDIWQRDQLDKKLGALSP